MASAGSEPWDARRVFFITALGLTVGVGAWLRLHNLGAESLWLDEASSWTQSKDGFAELISRRKRSGLATGNVGQRPFDMGYKSIYALLDIKQGKPAPTDPTYTGLDVCRRRDRRCSFACCASSSPATGASSTIQ
jgi:hypothetical protein